MTALHHETTGRDDAPPLILSGSLGTDLSMWDPQLPLAERFRLIRIDNRGHGRSPAPPGPYTIPELAADVLELMDNLELRQAAFAGISIGGMIGLWLAAHAPERITRLVSICSAAHVENGEAFRQRAAKVRAEGGTESIADAVVDRWLTPRFAATHPDERARLRAMLVATNAEGYAGCAEAVGSVALVEELSSVRAPTLVISGAQDTALPPPLQAQLADGIPDTRLATLDPAAHIASVERATEVNDLIAGHLV